MPRPQFLNIPEPLRALDQWAVATLKPLPNGKLDKAPRHPDTGFPISPTDRSAWVSFEQALNSGYPAIGVMLTEHDPFTIIDLDIPDEPIPNLDEITARHVKIYAAFDSYAERSLSGQGCHIVCAGKIGGGLNRDHVEVYDQERFIICTGDVVRASPIMNHQELLKRLVDEMGGLAAQRALAISEPEHFSDAQILQKLKRARNRDKFIDLYERAPDEHEDWSQRDAALAQMIAFYTRNHEQALRLFRGSKLYRPHDKGKNPHHYENYYLLQLTFGKAWEHHNREVGHQAANIEHGRRLAEKVMAKSAPTASPQRVSQAISRQPPIPLPPGLIGEIAQFIYYASERPVPEIALAGALTFCSGIFGRQYNISQTGLNLYTVMLADTGRGKEAASSGVNKLLAALRPQLPMVDNYRGPGHIASGQGLIRHLDEHHCCFSFLSEFGHILRIITSPRANAADIRTKQVFLDLFMKSGKNEMLLGSAYSDQTKNTKNVQAPCFAFFGDSTPENYYSLVSEGLIAEGLIPRFLTIHYDGPRVAKNEVPVASPNPELVQKLVSVFTSLTNMYHSNLFIDVPVSPDAKLMLDRFDKECDTRINAGDTLVELWNRAHLKVLRIAALVAVGRDMSNPIVDSQDAEWAMNLVRRELLHFDVRVKEGRFGQGESQYLGLILEATRFYLSLSKKERCRAYGITEAMAEQLSLIPYQFYTLRLRRRKVFQEDRRQPIEAIKSALRDAVELDVLQELSIEQKKDYALSGVRMNTSIYTLGPAFDQEIDDGEDG